MRNVNEEMLKCAAPASPLTSQAYTADGISAYSQAYTADGISSFLHSHFFHSFHSFHFFHLSCLVASLLLFWLHDSAAAQTTSSRMIGVGGTNVLDTYLSDEHFTGMGLSFLATVEYHKPQRHWTTLMEHEANLSSVKDRANKRSELEGAYNFYIGRLRGWQLLGDRLTLQAGALANVSLGFIYNTSNGNNPAQARAHLNIMPTGIASYRFRLLGKPMLARYELSLPLCGVQFSPNYGQSYYEIFSRGNYDHNIVPTTFVTAPEWRQLLTVDTQLSRRLTLRIGYLGNIQQSRVNNLRQHIWTHRALIGFTYQVK